MRVRRAVSGHLDSALVGDNPDQRKEREPARDLKHELAAPFHGRTGCGFLFSALTLGSISGFGVRSVSISENATQRPRHRRSRRMRRVSCSRRGCRLRRIAFRQSTRQDVTLLPVLRGFLSVPELLLGDAGDDPAVVFRPVMMPRG